ncbi:Rho GTPase-activating protein 20 [Halotydeus destructor]|nr:Rho GTPase-activating protein 20 [Halotydeus destructor]
MKFVRDLLHRSDSYLHVLSSLDHNSRPTKTAEAARGTDHRADLHSAHSGHGSPPGLPGRGAPPASAKLSLSPLAPSGGQCTTSGPDTATPTAWTPSCASLTSPEAMVTSGVSNVKLTKKISRSRTALNWPFKKLLKSESSTDSGISSTNGNNNMSPQPSPTLAAGRLFGQPLELLCPDGQLPKPVMNMLQQLFLKGPNTMGIFRKSASAKMIRELKVRLEEERELPLDEVPILVIGSIFKDFLRSLPGSLLDSRLYTQWILAANLANNHECRQHVHRLLGQLSPINGLLLRHFLCVLWHIAANSEENKMCSMNLAVCVGQSLLANGPVSGQCTSSAQQRCEEVSKCVPKLIAYLIDHCSLLFEEEVLGLFGPSSRQSAANGHRADSGADEGEEEEEEEENDSLSSLQGNHSSESNSSSHDVRPRRDSSSLDSLERDSDESSASLGGHLHGRPIVVQRLKKQASGHGPFANKMSLSNLSRDSGLTLSDTQLYNQDDDDHSDPREVSASVSPKPLQPATRGSHFTKSTPHLDTIESFENALNVTYSYGRSMGVSIDGSCHDVVRKRKYGGLYQEKEPRPKSSTARNSGTPSRLKSPFNSTQQLVRLRSGTGQLGRPFNQHQVPVDIHEEPSKEPAVSRTSYRYRRPPLAVMLTGGGRLGPAVSKAAQLELSAPGVGPASVSTLRRSASVESLASGTHRAQEDKRAQQRLSECNFEPASLQYHLMNDQQCRTYDEVDTVPRLRAPNTSLTAQNITNVSSQGGRKAQRIGSICSSTSETPSYQSSGYKQSLKSALSSCSLRSNPMSVAPPSYQDTMMRKEQLARMQSRPSGSRKLSSTSTGPSDTLYEQSLRVYSADIHSGSHVILRAVPVRVGLVGPTTSANAMIMSGQRTTFKVNVPSGEVYCGQEKPCTCQISAHDTRSQPTESPVVEQRCAKDFTDDWRSNIHWSVAHLRSLFNDQKSTAI